MVSGLFGPAEGAPGLESILETSQHRKIVEAPSMAVVCMVELGAQDFFYDSRLDGLMRGIARLLLIGGALLILSEYNVRSAISSAGI
jgi:hypothetical protein